MEGTILRVSSVTKISQAGAIKTSIPPGVLHFFDPVSKKCFESNEVLLKNDFGKNRKEKWITRSLLKKNKALVTVEMNVERMILYFG